MVISLSQCVNEHRIFIKLFDFIINCIKTFDSGWVGSVQTPCGVHEREGKKGGLKEGERWMDPPPKNYDRSPPMHASNSWELYAMLIVCMVDGLELNPSWCSSGSCWQIIKTVFLDHPLCWPTSSCIFRPPSMLTISSTCIFGPPYNLLSYMLYLAWQSRCLKLLRDIITLYTWW